jgi:hypothetical protein
MMEILRMKIKAAFTFLAFFLLLFFLQSFSQTQKPVDPVNWRKLVPYLVDMPGWKADGDPDGGSVSMGTFKMSQAERGYSAGEKSLRIQIADGGYVPMVYASIKMAMNFEIDTSEEFVKKITFQGYPGIEKYEYSSKSAEIILLLADRFLVQLEGDGFEDTSELKKIAENLDLKAIAGLAE